ncbi:MAG: CHAT domain-containing protein [bacterium]
MQAYLQRPSDERTWQQMLKQSGKDNLVPPKGVNEIVCSGNYLEGMMAVRDDDLEGALRILVNEPKVTLCHCLAVGNRALVLLRLGRYSDAEKEATEALEEIITVDYCPHPPSWIQFIRTKAEARVMQGHLVAALEVFVEIDPTTNKLILQYQHFTEAIKIEKAHAFNSWGMGYLQLNKPHLAVEKLKEALDIYRKYQANNTTGIPETLTHYAQALVKIGNPTWAELALTEAQDVAKKQSNHEQMFRIQIAAIEMESKLVAAEDIDNVLDAAIADARKKKLWGMAYIRLCIAITRAYEHDQHERAKLLIDDALAIESSLDAHDVSPAQLRHYQAQILRADGAPLLDVLRVMTQGARLWYEHLRYNLSGRDLRTMAEKMHAHFRLLTRYLIENGTLDQALMAFEAGRALGYSFEVDRVSFSSLLKTDNPFSNEDAEVNCTRISSVQSRLSPEEVCLVPVILPPDVVVFIVSNNNVKIVSLPLPSSELEKEEFLSNLRCIPVRLSESVANRAIPDLIVKICKLLGSEIGKRRVLAIMPHSLLHLVPWRAVLRSVGLLWSQLGAYTTFGLLNSGNKLVIPCSPTVIALGHGVAGVGSLAVDLTLEAIEFARTFGPDGNIKQGTSQNLTLALNSKHIVLVSCHGIYEGDTASLSLELEDGRKRFMDLLNETVSAPLVILSACDSGAYEMAWGDYPSGAAPELLRRGAAQCIVARFPVGADYARTLMLSLANHIKSGGTLAEAFARATEDMENSGKDLWREMAAFELISRV